MAKIHESIIKITPKTAKAVTGLKAVGAATKKLIPSFNQVRSAMLLSTAAVAGLTVAIFALVKSSAKAGDEFDKMSKRLGISAQTLSELKFAAELSGASIEDIEKSIKKLSRSAVDADRGLLTYQRAFDDLGVEVRDTNDVLKDSETLFNEVSEALVKVESNTKKTALAQELFGKSGTKLIPLFKEGVDGIGALREEARILGITYSDSAAASSAAFIDAEKRLTDSFKGIKIGIANELMEPMTNFFNNSAMWIAANRGDVVAMSKDWITSMAGMAESVLIGGATLTDWARDVATAYRTATLAIANMELATAKLMLIPLLDSSEAAKTVRDRINEISLAIVDIKGAQIISDQSVDNVERLKDAFEKIREGIRNAQAETVTPTIPTGLEGVGEDGESAKVQATQREIDQLNAMWDAQFLTERERLEIHLGEQLTLFEGNEAAKLTALQIFEDKKSQLILKEQEAEKKKALVEKNLRKQGFNDLVSNLAAMGQQSKTAFEAWKLGAIAQTVINTYQAAQGAYAALSSIPIIGPALGVAAAAAAVGAGIARVSAIKSQSFTGGGGVSNTSGGSVPSVGGFAQPQQPLIPITDTTIPVIEREPTRSVNITINVNGSLVDHAGLVDELAPFIDEAVEDKVININVT